MRAIVFPGQGSQFIGMGKEFYDNFSTAKLTFQEVDEALNQKLSHLIFFGDREDLNLTENTQPALLAVSMAIYRVFCQEKGFRSSGEIAAFMAGHSLGEYTALCAAGALSLVDAARLVKKRGLAMQEAVPLGQGAMAAFLGMSLDEVRLLLSEVSKIGLCELANNNSPGQVVISGELAAINYAEKIASDFGCKKAIRLPVSAPFHSRLMKSAAIIMEKELQQVVISPPKIPVFSNYNAEIHSNAQSIIELLVKQIYKPVLWCEIINYLVKVEKIVNFLEIGPSKVLTGLIKRIKPETINYNLEKPEDLDRL
jgi:[acyl-carrier-protein] S-malonyltransferase